MNYCSQCGAEVGVRVPEGDNRPRHVCGACGTIHYQNPKVVVGCIPEWGDQILLCRRAIEPRHGFWTLPAGFMERGETTQGGAARETLEEAQARVEVLNLYTLFNLPHIDQVYMLFRSRLLDLGFGPGGGKPGGAPVRGGRDPLGRDRLSGDPRDPQTLLCRPQGRRFPPTFRGHHPRAGRTAALSGMYLWGLGIRRSSM